MGLPQEWMDLDLIVALNKFIGRGTTYLKVDQIMEKFKSHIYIVLKN